MSHWITNSYGLPIYYFATLTCICGGSISTLHFICVIIVLSQYEWSTSSRLVMLHVIAQSKHW